MKFNFQTVLMIVFIAGAVIGGVVFATSGKGGAGNGQSVTITIWGSVPEEAMRDLILSASETLKAKVVYVKRDPETFQDDLVQALAAGEGPDLFLLNHEYFVQHANKIVTIPYENYPEDVFKESFIDEAQILLTPEGIAGFPFIINPMVMYYNRDILNSAFLVNPPQYWDELFTITPQIIQTTESGSIIQSAVALGTYDNISFIKDVITLIAMQSGNPLTGYNTDGELVSVFSTNGTLDSALRFNNAFSSPTQTMYSWNTSLPNDFDMFVAGDLALYFGYASELNSIRQRNPNLNFDVALMPQTRGQNTRMTHGNLSFLAISKVSPQIPTAFAVGQLLSSPLYSKTLTDNLLLPPIHRENFATRPQEDSFLATFYNSALISRAWLDPNPVATDTLFRAMIQDSTSGRVRINEAVRRLDAGVKQLLDQ